MDFEQRELLWTYPLRRRGIPSSSYNERGAWRHAITRGPQPGTAGPLGVLSLLEAGGRMLLSRVGGSYYTG